MYTVKDFAKMLGVTPQTLRNKHKKGELIPSIMTENNYRLYTDESAYKYNRNKKILMYASSKISGTEIECNLRSFNIDYLIHENLSEGCNYMDNIALRSLLKDISLNLTYTVLYHKEYIEDNELNLIKFYVESCFPNVKVKEMSNFSLNNQNKGE